VPGRLAIQVELALGVHEVMPVAIALEPVLRLTVRGLLHLARGVSKSVGKDAVAQLRFIDDIEDELARLRWAMAVPVSQKGPRTNLD
jgi:hypothetical protein